MNGEKKKEPRTEGQTKTDFDSTQKKKVPVTKKTTSKGSVLESDKAGVPSKSTDKITVHEPSHIKDDDEKVIKMKE